MADTRAKLAEGLVIHGRVPLTFRHIRHQRAAHLDRFHGAAREGAATEIFEDLPQTNAKSQFDQAALADVARQLDRQGAP